MTVETATESYRVRGFTRWLNCGNIILGCAGLAMIFYALYLTFDMLTGGPGTWQGNISNTLSFMSWRDHLDSVFAVSSYVFFLGILPIFQGYSMLSRRLELNGEGVILRQGAVTLQASWQGAELHRRLGQSVLKFEVMQSSGPLWFTPVAFSLTLRKWLWGKYDLELNPFTTRWRDSELRQRVEVYLKQNA